MSNNSFSYRFGEFECIFVSDGFILTGPGTKMEVTCLLLKSGKQNILIDTGCGISPQINAGKLVQNLEAEGIQPADIDMVIHTHGHTDHIGGNTDKNGRPVFSNARHIIHRIELKG